MRTWATSSEHLSVALQTTSLQNYCGSLPEDMASSILPCSGSRASRIAQQEYARKALLSIECAKGRVASVLLPRPERKIAKETGKKIVLMPKDVFHVLYSHSSISPTPYSQIFAIWKPNKLRRFNPSQDHLPVPSTRHHACLPKPDLLIQYLPFCLFSPLPCVQLPASSTSSTSMQRARPPNREALALTPAWSDIGRADWLET